MKHTMCACGKRKYACAKCTGGEDLCPHGRNRITCKSCILDRKRVAEEHATCNNELDYWFEREFKRNKTYLEKRPELLKQLQNDLEKQGIRGLSVVGSGEAGNSEPLKLVLNLST